MTDGRYYLGIDVGTTYIKTAIMDDDRNEVIGSFIERTGTDIKSSINTAFEGAINRAAVEKSAITHITATGFGRRKVSFADTVKTEISCHAKGAYHYFPRRITIIDIGGQDTKVIKVNEKGKRLSFKMNRKCAAGTGAFLEEIAYRLNIPIDKMNALAAGSTNEVSLSSFCTVFATTEVLMRIKDGEKIEDLVKSAYESVAKRVLEMEELEGTIVMTGGVVAHNSILARILERYIGKKILTPPYPQLIGAIGAALFARQTNELG